MNFLLDATAEALRANIGSKSAISLQRRPVDPKFQVEGVAPTNHSSSQKTRLNDLSYVIKIWTDFSSFLSQSTRLTDGRTDRQTEFLSLDRLHSIQRGKNERLLKTMIRGMADGDRPRGTPAIELLQLLVVFYLPLDTKNSSFRRRWARRWCDDMTDWCLYWRK